MGGLGWVGTAWVLHAGAPSQPASHPPTLSLSRTTAHRVNNGVQNPRDLLVLVDEEEGVGDVSVAEVHDAEPDPAGAGAALPRRGAVPTVVREVVVQSILSSLSVPRALVNKCIYFFDSQCVIVFLVVFVCSPFILRFLQSLLLLQQQQQQQHQQQQQR